MSHFYGSMQGSRGEATRCGTANSGFSAHIRGWDIGARVELSQCSLGDRVQVFRTSGSNATEPDKLIADFALNGLDVVSGEYWKNEYAAVRRQLADAREELRAYKLRNPGS